ncbi:MAG: Ig-like domain-containing protein [Kiloniellales bacterium]|nr:Ig-like domain-containing protein [Kiloniellales bacterium]
MQRSLLAGAAVVLAAIGVVAIFWTVGEDKAPAEKTVASQSLDESTASSALSETPQQAAGGEAAQDEPGQGESRAAEGAGASGGLSIREVPRAAQEAGEAPAIETAAGPETVGETGQGDSGAAASGGAADTQTAALPPEGIPPPASLRFDIVRVEPGGESVLAGRAEPGSVIVLLDGDEEIGRATADKSGSWAIVLDQPLAPGDHQLGLRAELPDGRVVLSETVVIVAVPEQPMAVARSGAPEPQVAAAAPTTSALAVETPREGLAASRVLQQPEEGVGLRDQALLLSAVDYDADGYLVVSGKAEPGARVVVYLDDRPLGTVVAGADGAWQLAPEAPVAPGLHRLRVDQLDGAGAVRARVATLFSRAELAGGFPDDRYVIVQPGNSLWRIARRTYGEGMRYSVIFQANSAQIADPDLIYPGQIFLVPSTN